MQRGILIVSTLNVVNSLEVFNLDQAILKPSMKPSFLINATYEAIEQFMAIYRTPSIGRVRKVTELNILIGTLRPEVQYSYQSYKAESLLRKLKQDERLREVAEKAHFTMVHFGALKESIAIGMNERKKLTEMIFAEFSDFLVKTITDEVGNVVGLIMKQMLRALLFTEKMSQ